MYRQETDTEIEPDISFGFPMDICKHTHIAKLGSTQSMFMFDDED